MINNFSGMRNPQVRELSDPTWRRWFDRLKALGVDKLAAGPSFNDPYTPTFDPRTQGSAVVETTPEQLKDKRPGVRMTRKSRSLGTPSVDALYSME